MNQLTTPTATIQSPDEVTRHVVLGGSIAVRLRREDTDGELGLIEMDVPGGYPGPPMHVHPDFAETFVVLEGEIAMCIAGRAHRVGAGGVAHVPRGVPHTFANPGAESVRFWTIVTPGGFEAYFDALAKAMAAGDGLPDPEAYEALGRAYGSIPA